MNKKYESFGIIQIPQISNKDIDGAFIKINGGNVILEFNHDQRRLPEDISIIAGTFTGLGYLTFYQCKFWTFSIGAGGNHYKYTVKYLFKGIYVLSEEDLIVDKLTFDSSTLYNWLDQRVTNREFNGDSVTIKLKSKVINEGTIPNLGKCKIFVGCGEKLSRSDMYLNFYAGISIEFTQQIHVKEANIIINQLIHLFAIILNATLKIESLFLKFPELESVVATEFIRELFPEVKQGTSHDYLIKYADIQNDIFSIIGMWLQNENIRLVGDLLLDQFFNTPIHIDTKFLNLCFGIETYHRQFRNSLELTPEKHEERIKSILDYIEDGNLNKWLKEKLKFSNELSFRKSLKSLLSDFPEYSSLTANQKRRITNQIVNSRNYYVHYSSESGKLNSQELYYYGKFLELILKSLLLIEMGLDSELISEKRSKYINAIIKNLEVPNSA